MKIISGVKINPPVTRCRLNEVRPRLEDPVESGLRRGRIRDEEGVDSFPKSILGRIKF